MPSISPQLQILQVFNVVTGKFDDADRYLKQGERRLNRTKRLLTDLREQKKKYLVCPFCHGPLYIRGGSKRPHFVHFSKAEEFNSCPYKEGIRHLTPNEIKALQYNGIQESKRHKYLKNTIGEIIATTEGCTNTIIDKCYLNREKNERRRPDIQTTYNGKSIVFEIQLSKEFITIISDREEYYRQKDAFLIWIFDKVTDINEFNQSVKNIFYSNNCQIFYLDKELINKSKKYNKLYLYVAYNIPFIDENNMTIKNSFAYREISLEDIIFNKETLSSYFYPYDENFNELRRTIIYRKLTAFLSNNDAKGLDQYLHKISDIVEPFNFQLSTFILFMLSAKYGTDILKRGDNQFHSNYSQLLNPKGGGKSRQWLLYFYTILKTNGHNFIKETSIQNCEKLLKDFKKNPNIENVSFLYPTKQWEPLFAFLFPKEYKEFLKLIRWIKIPWTPIDTSHFEILETY